MADRLSPSPAGLPANYGSFTSSQANAIGTDTAGNTSTFAEQVSNVVSGKAGADNGFPFAIDWFGNGTAVSGNAGLVNAPAAGATPLGGAIGQANADAVSGNWIQDWAVRGALIILGFIFVGVGLNMFGRAGTTIAVLSDGPAKAAQKAGKVATEAA